MGRPAKKEGPSASVLLEQAIAIVGNVTPSVLLILLNKILLKSWNFPLTLTLFHMVFLTISMELAAQMDFFKPKPMELKQILMVGLSGVGSIAFMNLSLTCFFACGLFISINLCWNSVGVYQLMKLACIPCTVLVQTMWYQERFTWQVNASLVLVMVGIGITTVTDVHFNVVGLVMGILAVISTTQYQIWIGSKQKELQMSQFQLLHRVGPAMAFFTLLSVPLLECGTIPNTPSVFQTPFSLHYLSLSLASCVAAVGVNFSTYVLINRTSVVTYLVVGHLKTVLILVLGSMFLSHGPTDMWNIAGICMSMFGIIVYGFVKNIPAPQKVDKSK